MRSSFFNLSSLLLLAVFSTIQYAYSQDEYSRLIDSANVAEEKMNYQSELYFLEDALELSEKSKDNKRIVSDLIRIGRTYVYLDDMNESLEHYLRALRLSEKMDNDTLRFECFIKISYYYMEINELTQAEDYLNKMKRIATKLGDKLIYSRYYNNLGVLERRKNNLEASIRAYTKGLDLIPSDSLEDKFSAFINLSTAHGYNKDFQTAISYLLQAEELNETLQNDMYTLVLSGQLGRINLLLGNTDKAIEYYISGLDKSIESQNHKLTERFNRELARTHYKRGEYREAYEYYAAFVIELQNSQKRENSRAIAEMSAKYEHEKKEQKIVSLEKEKELTDKIHRSRDERKNLWLALAIIVAALTIVIAIIVFRNQRNKQRLRLELVQKQEELARQEAELKGQEVERNRLSRELHDGLGGTLSSIKMRLSSKNLQELDPILKDIDAACEDVRNMSHSLNSSIIDDMSFYSLLLKLCDDIRMRSSLDVNLEFMPVEKLNSLESERRHQCYRIIQELTNNTIKHAQAGELTIGLMENNDDVILLVEDDGIGFDATNTRNGIGLSNIRKRLENLQGELDIRSKPNEGTTFSISFPFN